MDLTVVLKPLTSLSKLLEKHALRHLERTQLVVSLLKGTGFDILHPDFESVYVHALVEYSIDNQDKGTWIAFFSLKETKEYIKEHLYKKPQDELSNKLDGLLHTGQGEVFLQLKRQHAQTQDAEREYLSLKKYLNEYTIKSQNPQQAYQTELVQEALNEINTMREEEAQQTAILQNIDSNAQAILAFVGNLSAELKLNTTFLLKLAEVIDKMQLPAPNQQQLITKINNMMDNTLEQFKQELSAILQQNAHLGIVEILEKIDRNLTYEQYDRVKWVAIDSKTSPIVLAMLADELVRSTQSLINSIH